MQGDAFAFEAGGMEPGVAGANDVRPQAIEALAIAGKPLPGNARASGGRCYHSTVPKLTEPARLFPKKQAERSALANRLVDEAAKPDIHHKANRQKNKQCSRASVAH